LYNMGTKEKRIEKILHIEDEKVLEDIMKMIDLELELVGDEIKLTAEQKIFIEEGLEDIKEGRVVSQDDAKKIVKDWLKWPVATSRGGTFLDEQNCNKN
jgi:hypothetical protein